MDCAGDGASPRRLELRLELNLARQAQGEEGSEAARRGGEIGEAEGLRGSHGRAAAIYRQAEGQADKGKRRWKHGYLARHVADKLRGDGVAGDREAMLAGGEKRRHGAARRWDRTEMRG
ncbi:hypothetical protein E2562_009401 [Oryza meyeriana var. granulata]|uniref:Uncharacterized protein n=1 Tax=Oryza meyeriana var. granulata TaxID=110450 RepID=A0A6G1BTZ7_9ORYZ|nr:hypothetical protein E2562_009401 [Oryza meyeriana var. granulata]